MAPAADRISFAEPIRPRRFSGGIVSSTAVTSNDGESDEENHYEDWTKTTSDKDSWANRERRRSNKFSKIDHDMAAQFKERSRSGRRASSALGIFSQGVDKNGNAIILSDDTHDGFEMPVAAEERRAPGPSLGSVFARNDERRLSMSSQNSDKRRGSILSLWKTGKDKDGRDHVHSGHEGEDWVDAISNTSGSMPSSPRLAERHLSVTRLDDPRDRRGSILSIWKQGKDRDGNMVIHSGEEHDVAVVPVNLNGMPIEEEPKMPKTPPPQRERVGSILSIWSQGKDKDGKTVIHSGDEHEGPIEVTVEKMESPRLRGTERRGSILSMWAEEKQPDTQDKPAPVFLTPHYED